MIIISDVTFEIVRDVIKLFVNLYYDLWKYLD